MHQLRPKALLFVVGYPKGVALSWVDYRQLHSYLLTPMLGLGNQPLLYLSYS
jgi:hypothetical protein